MFLESNGWDVWKWERIEFDQFEAALQQHSNQRLRYRNKAQWPKINNSIRKTFRHQNKHFDIFCCYFCFHKEKRPACFFFFSFFQIASTTKIKANGFGIFHLVWIKNISYNVFIHREFLEYWNTQKSVWRIWQHFSCLLDEGIPKIWKKLNSHGGLLRGD